MTRLTVLGATGWIGRSVTELASARGWDVTTVDRGGTAPVGIVASDRAELDSAIRESHPDVVVNCIGGRSGSVAALVEANIDAVRCALRASAAVGARFVHLGSAAEYGTPRGAAGSEAMPLLDETAPLLAESDYARTKAVGSCLVAESDADAVVARIFNIVGPDPAADSFLGEMIGKVRTAADGVVRLGNAGLVRDWVPLSGVAAAILALGEADDRTRVVNVCSGRGTSHGELVEAIGRRLGVEVTVLSAGSAGIRSVVGDPSALMRVTGLDLGVTADKLVASLTA